MSEFRHKERKKVVAEITLSHVTEFAAEIGRELGQDEAMVLLNRGELAQEMWVHMMQAAEQYIKAALMHQCGSEVAALTAVSRTAHLLSMSGQT